MADSVALAPDQPAPKLTGVQWLICIIAVIGFAFDTYERELERYGGEEGTRAAEAIFGRDSELVGELRPWKDHEAQAEIEAHDTDQMLDSINDHRRRRGGRDIGEELADEAIRGTWEEP